MRLVDGWRAGLLPYQVGAAAWRVPLGCVFSGVFELALSINALVFSVLKIAEAMFGVRL